jgi:hypothetical protein
MDTEQRLKELEHRINPSTLLDGGEQARAVAADWREAKVRMPVSSKKTNAQS